MRGLHAWGLFRREWRGMGWRLVSHHKTQQAALDRSRPGDRVSRISTAPRSWVRR
jgi:hypothetical protein